MDNEFLVLSLAFILIGASGIVLFYGPMTASGDSCYCLIPSPEPGAAQGTSSIILVLGLLFFPMGLMKGGMPSFRRIPQPAMKGAGPAGAALTPSFISSGKAFAAGIAMLVLGVDAVLVPGYLVLKSMPVAGAGAVVAALGGVLMYWGSRRAKTGQAQ